MELKCEICGKIFSHDQEKYCRASLTRHIKQDHSIELYDYIVKYLYNNIPPLCACGCGNPVKLSKGWHMNKYFSDSHVVKSKSTNAKIKETLKNTFNPNVYYPDKYDISIFTDSVNDYKSKEYSMADIAKKYQLDRRTIKSAWFKLNLITEKEFEDIANYAKYKLSTQKRVENNLELNSTYAYLYNLVKTFPGKYNKQSMIKYYNDNNINKITKVPDSIFKDMYKLYGDDFVLCLQSGYHSKEEYMFYSILSYYLPQIKIELGKKFEHENGYSIYDICIGDKLLIEYDSTKKYHSSEYEQNNDSFKELLAEKLNYDFMRLNKNNIKDISILIKLKQYCNDNIYGNNIVRNKI